MMAPEHEIESVQSNRNFLVDDCVRMYKSNGVTLIICFQLKFQVV